MDTTSEAPPPASTESASRLAPLAARIGRDPRRFWATATSSIPALSPDRWVSGTAAGLAQRVGVTTPTMRGVFVVLVVAGGWGIPLYVAALLTMRRWGTPLDPRRIPDETLERHIGLALVTLGFLAAMAQLDLGFVGAVVWPTAAVMAGAAIAWGQDDLPEPVSLAMRVGLGLMVAVAGIAAARVYRLGADELVVGLALAGSIVVGLAVIVGPALWRATQALDQARRDQARTDERDRMAAHLHDSVLQTLSLIQRNSDRADLCAQLARRQERELRNWLYDSPTDPSTVRFGPEILAIADQIEADHGIPVEVVTVGDAIDEDAAAASHDMITAVLAATREAITNAAKHSNAEQIDVFCEIGPNRIETFVRDTGRGFDADEVGSDRRGIADSIKGRMDRVGGGANVHSSSGVGTEVEIWAPLTRTIAPATS